LSKGNSRCLGFGSLERTSERVHKWGEAAKQDADKARTHK
jgi:hypothetical protein